MTNKNILSAQRQNPKTGRMENIVITRRDSQDEIIRSMGRFSKLLKKLGFISWEMTNDGSEQEEAPNDRFR